ncbi:ATP adenylyltransferase C-terminal [Fusarium beomiforme]|uniref:ATP adenylyltransferase C-terminal n=1 Tax=Fusarium beomiforme TaxID=44412 RepID=A0A9P5E204_9HYPO|nr:ATP adenylyltransferase C-terminal [Fusarium beomiforme]
MDTQKTATAIDGSFVLSQFDALIKSGLVQFDENQKIIEYIDGDLKFHFVLTRALLQKPTLATSRSQPSTENQNATTSTIKHLQPGSDIDTNGFEIWDSNASGHFLIANKFCFSRPHLMMLTRDGFQRQYEPLNESDFEASWGILNSLNSAAQDYVVFYNCGKDGGCSRLHKHVQLMPLPACGFAVDFLNLEVSEKPSLPFKWFYHRLNGTGSPGQLNKIYFDLLQTTTKVWEESTGNNVADGHACPHNVAFTNRWIVVIPRRCAAINKEAGVNSLGMLGIIAVATEKEIDNWIQLGLTKSLAELGVPS